MILGYATVALLCLVMSILSIVLNGFTLTGMTLSIILMVPVLISMSKIIAIREREGK